MYLLTKSELLIFNKNKIQEFLLYLFIFLPYLTVFTTRIDTSPYALVYSTIVFFFIKYKKFPVEIHFLLLGFIFACILLLLSKINLLSIRLILGYFSVFIIASTSYYILKKNNGFNKNIFYIFLMTWFIVGFIQTFIDNTFLTFLVNRFTSGGGRGVTGLAPEPTYYGTIGMFFFLISYITNYKVKFVFFIVLVEILVFSKSSTAILLSLFIICIYALLQIKNKKIFFITILIVLLLPSFITFLTIFEGTRFFGVLSGVFSDPLYLLTRDESVSERFFHVFFAYKGMIDNWFLPNGFSYFGTYMSNNIDLYHPYTNLIEPKEKIMSGIGEIFFELGIFGIVYLISLFMLTYKHFSKLKDVIFVNIFIIIIMSTSIPLTFPLFGFVYGLLSYLVYSKRFI